MIAPRENKLRFLLMGLQPSEDEILQQYARKTDCEMVFTKDELDLWNHARNGQFDLFILSQTDDIPDPSYLIWLLKGLANHSKVILVLSQVTAEIEERLDRFHASYALERPIRPEQLEQAIDTVLHSREEKENGVWNFVSRIFPHRKHVKVLNG